APPEEHCGRNVDQRFGVPLRLEPLDQPEEDQRKQHDLEDQGQRGRVPEVPETGAVRHEARGGEEDRSLPCEKLDEPPRPTLRQHGEGDEQEPGAETVQELGGESRRGHRGHAPRSRCTRRPSTARRKAIARNSGARKMRSLAETVSTSASAAPARASLSSSATTASASVPG